MSLFTELKRRNVFRVGIAYLVGAWLLLQLADVMSELLKLPETFGPIVVAVVAIGFPVVLFFAWAYELTPEGVKRESEVDRSQSVTGQTGKKLNNAILVMMALAIAYLLYDKFSDSPNGQAVQNPAASQGGAEPEAPADTAANRLSIAVLPFENRSNREEDQFFTDGIHDDLLTTIAKIGSMKVISRTSVMEYKGTTKKIPEIAAELGVANILEGGIQRSGNHVRINVQLIDANTDEHLWAEIYDRELTAENLFAIQSEISNAIANALQATLTPQEQQRIDSRPTQNLAAFEAYLRGKQIMATRRIADLEQATKEFMRAVELDPRFALAWVGVADSHDLLVNYASGSEADTIAIRENAVQQALSIDPNLGEAYASLATIHEFHGRFDEAEAAFQRAIELSPNYATAYHWYAVNIANPLRSRERLQLLLKARELDPRSMIINMALGGEYRRQGLFSQAERQFLDLLELAPDFPNGLHGLADQYMFDTGEYAKALDLVRRMEALDPRNYDPLRHQAEIYLELGDFEAAERARERIADLDPEHYLLGTLGLLAGTRKGSDDAVREAFNWVLPRIQDRDLLVQYLARTQLILGDAGRATWSGTNRRTVVFFPGFSSAPAMSGWAGSCWTEPSYSWSGTCPPPSSTRTGCNRICAT